MLITELPRDKHYKYLYAAYMAALSCPGYGRNSFRLGSVIVYKKDILAAKHNCMKTHPKLLPYYKFPFLHAEANSIISLGVDNCAYTRMYVVRILKNRTIALAKPCISCQQLLTYAQINDIFYSTLDGYEKL